MTQESTPRLVLFPTAAASATPEAVPAEPPARYARIRLSADEGRVLDALLAKDPDGLRGREIAQALGEGRLYAGKVATALVRLRLVRKAGRYYHLRPQEERS